MKKKNKLFTLIITSALTFSCGGYLDVVPNDIATVDIAFNSRQNSLNFLSTCYSYLPNFGNQTQNPALISGDEVWFFDPIRDLGGSDHGWLIAKGEQNANAPYMNYWNGSNSGKPMFQALRDCNIFLENINRPRDLQEYERLIWVAEVKVLKAYYHYWLMNLYGPIPIIDENFPVYSEIQTATVERKPVDEVVNYIVGLIDEAMPDLQTVLEDPFTDRGRITQTIAKAMKAKVLVTAASPLFNGNADFSTLKNSEGQELINSTFDVNKWKRAADACKEAIDAAVVNGHILYTNFPVPAGYSNMSAETIRTLTLRASICEAWNPEIVWGAAHSPADYIQNLSMARIDPANILNERAKGLYAPTLKMAELFYSKNGVPIEEDKNYDYEGRFELRSSTAADRRFVRQNHVTVKLHFDREPRFYSSLAFDGAIWEAQKAAYDDNAPFFVDGIAGKTAARTGVSNYSITGYYPKKLVHYLNVIVGSTMNPVRYPWPVVRLADLHLLYAEALNESEGPTASVYSYVDMVRSRAGLPGVVDAWTQYSNNPNKPSTKEGMREIIQQERLIELAFEGQRYWDLRRWKKAVDVMNGPVRGWTLEENTPTGYYRIRNLYFQRFTTKDYLWPLKVEDLVVNTKLQQNPGW